MMRWGILGLVMGLVLTGCGSSKQASDQPDAGSAGSGGSSGASDAIAGADNSAAGSAGSNSTAGDAAGGSGGEDAVGGSDSTSWVHQLGTADAETVRSVGVDAQGNVVLFSESKLAGAVTSSGFDAHGNPLWSHSINERLWWLTVVPNGSVFAVGEQLVQAPDKLRAQPLLVSYDEEGKQRFRTVFGSVNDRILYMTVGDNGHSFVFWYHAEAVDGAHNALTEFDGGGAELSTVVFAVAGNNSSFIVDRRGNLYLGGDDGSQFMIRKVNLQGQEVWSAPISNSPAGLYVDDADNVYYTASNRASFGKLDSNGQPMLDVSFGTSENGSGPIAADAQGNIFVASVNGGLGPTTANAAIYRFDPMGNEVAHWAFASDGYDTIRALVVDSSGAAIVAGETEGTLPSQTSFGSTDVFIARIQP